MRVTLGTGAAATPAVSIKPSLERRLVQQLNARYMDYAWRADRALRPKCVDRERWALLDENARAQIASFPMALVALPSTELERFGLSQRPSPPRPRAACRLLRSAGEFAMFDLGRYALIVAWHLAHCARGAWLMIGLPMSAMNILSLCTVDEIEALAEELAGRLRPRWEDNAAFWEALLRAADRCDERQWRQLQMHGLQLLGRDILRDQPNSR